MTKSITDRPANSRVIDHLMVAIYFLTPGEIVTLQPGSIAAVD
jgi:hypothetical protein